ncbi:hypothetical protein [Prevotella sp. 10(H)]|uniref:hypothetical protein n=1 Tax=Prevotella sp. 10(H) TaxID=1158294 RepID=UPI000A9550CF|nr:hypothetical protein [Prevotella sp. 10(H)]
MKLRTLLFLITLLSVQFAVAQKYTYSSVISDEEIYNFLNWMTENDKKTEIKFLKNNKKVSYKIMPWDTANFISKYVGQYDISHLEPDNKYLFKKSSGLDTLFNQEERNFFYEQYISIKDSVWHQGMSGKKMISAKKKDDTNVNYYSIPLFSRNKEYVLIYKVYICGYECSYGKYYLYKFDVDRWRFLMSLNPWSR